MRNPHRKGSKEGKKVVENSNFFQESFFILGEESYICNVNQSIFKMAKNNPILKTLSVGDIVLVHIPTDVWSRTAPIRQIVKLTKADYEPGADFDWMNFEGEVIFTSERVHASEPNLIFGNCLAISEKLNPFLIEKYKKDFMLFPPTENQLSDEELEYLQKRFLD